MSATTKILAFASLLVLAAFATIWTNAAYNLATWGWTVAGSLGNATFLPFPTPPRGILMEIIVAMNPTDLFIYENLLKTGALTALCLLLWASGVFSASVAIPPLLRKQDRQNEATAREPDQGARCPCNGLYGFSLRAGYERMRARTQQLGGNIVFNMVIFFRALAHAMKKLNVVLQPLVDSAILL